MEPRQPLRGLRIGGAGWHAAGEDVGDLVDRVEGLMLGRLRREAGAVWRGVWVRKTVGTRRLRKA